MFSDPYAKLCFNAMLTSQLERTVYIDLDTMFAAYFAAELLGQTGSKRLDIYLPAEGRLVPVIRHAIASMSSSSLVVLDSVNSFYNLFKINEKALGSLNHLLSILLMLFVRHGVDSHVPVLATSMLRYRNSAGWVQSPASRRLLQNKSAVRMRAEMKNQWQDLAVTVLQHDLIPPETQFVYKNCAIAIA